MFTATSPAVTGNNRASWIGEGRAAGTRRGSLAGVGAGTAISALRQSGQRSLCSPKEKAGRGFPQLKQLAIESFQSSTLP
jgi:hypothetical protein